jgi:GT2 family glycosyltransferase
MEDLTISIGTLGNYDLLEECLRSVYQEDAHTLTYRVSVIFNGPKDDGVTERIAREFPQVTVFKRKGPLGYCATHNTILNGDHGRFVLILDDDTIVPKGTLADMVAFVDAHADVGMAGCKTLNPDGTLQKSFGLFPSTTTEFMAAFKPNAFWPERLYHDMSRPVEVEWLNGSFMLVRSEVVKAVGGLDDHYYTYVCEPDWCFRIRQAGWKVMFVPHVEITHVGGEHSINTTAKQFHNLIRYHVNRYYFFHRHYGPLSMFLLRPIMIVGALLRIAYFFVLYLLRPSARSIAETRMQAFWRVIQLSLSPRPYNLPVDFQTMQAVAGKRHG